MNAQLILRRQALLGTAFLALMFFGPTAARAVVFASTGDPEFNTTTPTGELADSGWQFQGEWYSFTGTPVSPHHFITAKHVGGTVGANFKFQGIDYVTVGVTNNGTDLNVWEISGTFPTYAPLFQGSNTNDQPVVIFGRGTQRGDEVVVNDQVKGWLWGASDGRLRWGENVVAGKYGALLKFLFDRDAGPNEAHLTTGDSGGAIFVNDNGVWKLAAINYAIEGPWRYTSSGATFNAALVDKGGLYRGNTLYPDNDLDNPAAFYATPIASNIDWLRSVLKLAPAAPKAFRIMVTDSAAAAPNILIQDFRSPRIESFRLKQAITKTGP